MTKLNKNEKFVKNAALSLASTVNDSSSYTQFMGNIRQLFKNNEITVEGREEIINSVKRIFNENSYNFSEDTLNNDFATLPIVASTEKHSVPAMIIDKIKNTKKGTKVAVASGIVVIGGALAITAATRKSDSIVPVTSASGSYITSDNNDKSDIINNNNDSSDQLNNLSTDDQNPLLGFDPSDKRILIGNIYDMFKDSLPKGHKITKGNIAQETENWIDAYVVANIENLGPDFLLKYYQNDSKKSLAMIENYLRVVSQVDTDSQVSVDSWDLNGLFANKADQKLIKKYQSIVSNIVFNAKDKNKNNVRKYSQELRSELEKLVRSNGSRQYSDAAIVMAINLGFAGANSAKVVGMADVVIPSDLRRVLYTDGAVKCQEALAQARKAKKENRKKVFIQYGGKDNVYMKSVLGMYEQMEDSLDKVIELYSNLTEIEKKERFENEISYNNSLNSIIDKTTKILDTYKANISYIKAYYKNLKLGPKAKTKTITKTTVVKSSTAKKISKKKKAGKKVTTKDINSKDFIKGKVKGKSGKVVTTKSKQEQLLVEQASKEGYTNGWNSGNKKGALGKSKFMGIISVPSKFKKSSKATAMYKAQYKSAFNAGYKAGLEVYKKNKDVKKEVVTGKKTDKSDKVHDVEDLKPKDEKPSTKPSDSENKKPSNGSNEKPNKVESGSSDKGHESDVYDIEELSVNKSVQVRSLKKLKAELESMQIEQPYEEERKMQR